MAKPLCIVTTGEPVPEAARSGGTFANMIQTTVGDAWAGDYVVVDVRTAELPALEAFAAFIITGSASSVTERAPWMLQTESYLKAAVEREAPIFGVCFGHQLLAQALGGKVERNPRGREIGTVSLDVLEADPLLVDLETFDPKVQFAVNTTHVDTVTLLPVQARVLARTSLEPHAVLRFSPTCYGVQFHPELNGELTRSYIQARRSQIESEGLDPDGLFQAAQDTPKSVEMLRRFVQKLAQP